MIEKGNNNGRMNHANPVSRIFPPFISRSTIESAKEGLKNKAQETQIRIIHSFLEIIRYHECLRRVAVKTEIETQYHKVSIL